MVAPDPERWKIVEELFFGALEMAPEARAQWLAGRCGSDAALLSQVEAMLAADESAAGKLDGAVKAAAVVTEQVAPMPASQAGWRLGQFVVIREIGRAATSTIYEAKRTGGHSEARVRIKMLARGVEFSGEREALARLEHPSIVRLLESGTTSDGRPYLVTDYAEGIAVNRYCREMPIHEPGKLAIFLSICEAVEHVHERKLVLRGLKPAHIVVSPEGRPRLVDCSDAAPIDPESAGKAAPISERAAGYASPEVLRGERASVRSDVYSLGAILFEMVTGQRAVAGQEDQSPLCAIARKALSPDPARRFASVSELAAAVRNYSSGPRTAARPSWTTIGIAAGGLAAMAFAMEAVNSWWNRSALMETVDSIAVLPFVNLGMGQNEDATSDGLTEDITTALVRVKGLKVPSRTAVWQYKGKVVDIRAVGRKLGVRAVLEGSVRKSGGQLRIAAQSIDVSDGFKLWAGSFDGEADGVLEMQRDVAAQLTEDLKKHLARRPGRASPDGAARRAYLEGYQQFDREAILNEWATSGGSSKLRATLGALEQATRLDPNFAAGWAGLGEASEFAATLDARNRRTFRDGAESAATRALVLEPTNPLALATLGHVYMAHDWNLRQAEPYFRRAIESSPHSTAFHTAYANVLAVSGRYEEAVELLRRSELLDPDSPRPSGRMAALAATRGDSAGSRQHASAALARDARDQDALWALGMADELDGNVASAEHRCRRALELHPADDQTLASVGHLLARAGRRKEGVEIAGQLHALVEQERRQETGEALVRTGLGEKDVALSLIEEAWRRRDANVLTLDQDWRFRRLVSEARFQELAKRLQAIR